MRIILIPADRRLNRTGDFSCLFISKSYNRKVIGLVSRLLFGMNVKEFLRQDESESCTPSDLITCFSLHVNVIYLENIHSDHPFEHLITLRFFFIIIQERMRNKQLTTYV